MIMCKVILCSIAKDEEDWIPLMLESVKPFIKKFILVLDNRTSDNTLFVSKQFCYKNNIEFEYVSYSRDDNDKGSDGKQRNIYIDILKKKHIGEWILVLDADEIWKGNLSETLGEIIDKYPSKTCFDLKFRHLLSNFGHEDATLPEHWTARRLFQMKDSLFYPELEHNVLSGIELDEIGRFPANEVFHFAHCRKSAFYWKDKFDGAMQRSTTHSPEFKEQWYYSHILGQYPGKSLNYEELPAVIKNKFFPKESYKPMTTLISIATVPGNTKKLLECISSIERFTKEEHQILITMNDYRSFSYGHNKALSKVLVDDEISGVVIINDDVRINKFDWLDKLREASHKGSCVSGVNGSNREYKNIKYLAFYCTYFPKRIIEKVGLLDEQFKIAECEDVDYCIRTLDAGFNLTMLTQDICSHDQSFTLGNLNELHDKERKMNQVRLRSKWQQRIED